jgi:hypothetical protein
MSARPDNDPEDRVGTTLCLPRFGGRYVGSAMVALLGHFRLDTQADSNELGDVQHHLPVLRPFHQTGNSLVPDKKEVGVLVRSGQ